MSANFISSSVSNKSAAGKSKPEFIESPPKEKVVLFLPAYFAEKTLESVYHKIPKQYIDHIILVDDGSKDGIEQVARDLNIQFYRNEQNLGYGGNLKVCVKKALEMGADILIELHPDDQYDPSAIPQALDKLREGNDLVMGSRFTVKGLALSHGMPSWKYWVNRLSSLPAQLILGVNLTDFHSGFRLYRQNLLRTIQFERNDNDYLFSFQLIAEAAYFGFKIAETPVTCRYFKGATQINFQKCITYGAGALGTLFLFLAARLGLTHRFFQRADHAPLLREPR